MGWVIIFVFFVAMFASMSVVTLFDPELRRTDRLDACVLRGLPSN